MNRSRRGFTLIELLVVISIIALLVGILLPALSKAKSAALFLGCQTNMRSIGQATHTFALDHNDRKPPAAAKWFNGKWWAQDVTPQTRIGNVAVGMGRLIDEDYLVFATIQDHGRNMALDRELDLDRWRTSSSAGSSYLYFYRETPEAADPFDGKPPGDPTTLYTMDRAADLHQHALVSDANLRDAVGYIGAFGAGNPWVSHPEEGRSNFLFLDGSVGNIDNDDMYIAGSSDAQKRDAQLQDWFERGHQLYSNR